MNGHILGNVFMQGQASALLQNQTHTLLQALLQEQRTQTELLRRIANPQSDHKAQVEHWQSKNPELAKRCAAATHQANDMMDDFVENMVGNFEEIKDEQSWDGENYKLLEFIDRYGSKIQQFQTVLQTLHHLGS
jgi:hypothetical protein